MAKSNIEPPRSTNTTALQTQQFQATQQPLPHTMQAVICAQYGSAEHLNLRIVDRPKPSDNEVLVRVSATPVTAADTLMRQGSSLIGRLVFGWKRPKIPTPGTGFSGTIVATGPAVSNFFAGDKVFGETGVRFSAHAEYVCLPAEGLLMKIPEAIDEESAATYCDGPLTSYNFLVELANLQRGDKLLINGASGSLGTAAIQIAKDIGAHVTAVCSVRNIELVRSLGADDVIDYNERDYTDSREQYDVIYDCVGKSSYCHSRAALKPNGRYTCPVFSLHHLLLMAFTQIFMGKKALFSATGLMPVPKLKALLTQLLTLVETGKIQTVIDRRYQLDEIVQANTYVDTERKSGNVVVTMHNSE